MGAGKVKKRVIGLLGNSGSGKSTVAAYLRKLGADVVDADQIARELCAVGEMGYAAVKSAFGGSFFEKDGSMNRRRLGEYVFADQDKLARLNALLHPLVLQEIGKRMQNVCADVVVIDCALLIAVGLNALTDEIWLIKANNSSKIERICTRDGIDAANAKNRLSCQMTDKQMERYADVVIRNDSTCEVLLQRIKELYDEQSEQS